MRACTLWLHLVLIAQTLAAAELQKQAGSISVRVAETTPAAGVPRVEIATGGRHAVTIDLDNRTASVEDLRILGEDYIVVAGKTYTQYPRMDTITIIDVKAKKIADTIWALDAAFSPDGKTVAYFYRTPHTGQQGEPWGSLVAYDLTSPASNTWAVRDQFANHPHHDRGIVLYPDKHREARRYWFLLPMEEGWLNKEHVRYAYVPHIAWSQDSRRLAIVERDGWATVLVVIDVSNGIRQPSISKKEIPREPFLDPRLRVLGQDDAARWVPVSTFEFTEDGTGIRVTTYGRAPYAAKTVTLQLGEGSGTP